ncbi:hypothetical protein MLIT_52080 [Mycolicibacterium litorale]|uniref:Uncharacterized protein n=1 Tax=Mycolicibacterium litorale TaxID=758802 RepID=A0AAD1IRK3_9MYCO|nr:hypothetical protein MLIT_52080 [Mycolicibacterium litorale]
MPRLRHTPSRAVLVGATQLGGVTAHLLRCGGVHTHQFQIRAADDRPQRMAPDVTRAELDDSPHRLLRSPAGPLTAVNRTSPATEGGFDD